MLSKIKLSILSIMLVAFAPTLVNSQSVSKNMLDLDPNIIAAANCNGAVVANAMMNFQNGVLNEERARVMLRTTTLAFVLTATKHQSAQHLIEYEESYQEFFADSYQSTYDDIIDGNFTWDSQAGIDVCTARIFVPLTSVSEQDLARSGINNYFEFIESISATADQRFDYMLRLMDAIMGIESGSVLNDTLSIFGPV